MARRRRGRGDSGKLSSGRRAVARRWYRLKTWRLEGLPEGLGTFEWLFSAAVRLPGATFAALFTAWTAAVIALWIAAFSAIATVVLTAFGITVSGQCGWSICIHIAHVRWRYLSRSIRCGCCWIRDSVRCDLHVKHHWCDPARWRQRSSSVSSLAFSSASSPQSWSRRCFAWRGYRRPSRRERDEHLDDAAATGSRPDELTVRRTCVVMDSAVPQAWTYTRTIVLSKGLIERLDAEELAGVLAHEMTHWRRGDGFAMRMVWCFGWPVGILYGLGMFLQGARFGASEPPHSSGKSTVKGATTFLTLLGWMFLWPSWLLTRFVLIPMTAKDSRLAEYEADAGASAIGLGDGLSRALQTDQCVGREQECMGCCTRTESSTDRASARSARR